MGLRSLFSCWLSSGVPSLFPEFALIASLLPSAQPQSHGQAFPALTFWLPLQPSARETLHFKGSWGHINFTVLWARLCRTTWHNHGRDFSPYSWGTGMWDWTLGWGIFGILPTIALWSVALVFSWGGACSSLLTGHQNEDLGSQMRYNLSVTQLKHSTEVFLKVLKNLIRKVMEKNVHKNSPENLAKKESTGERICSTWSQKAIPELWS